MPMIQQTLPGAPVHNVNLQQAAHDRAHIRVAEIVNQWQAGLITLAEFAEKMRAAGVPDGVPGMLDRGTGLRY